MDKYAGVRDLISLQEQGSYVLSTVLYLDNSLKLFFRTCQKSFAPNHPILLVLFKNLALPLVHRKVTIQDTE